MVTHNIHGYFLVVLAMELWAYSGSNIQPFEKKWMTKQNTRFWLLSMIFFIQAPYINWQISNLVGSKYTSWPWSVSIFIKIGQKMYLQWMIIAKSFVFFSFWKKIFYWLKRLFSGHGMFFLHKQENQSLAKSII